VLTRVHHVGLVVRRLEDGFAFWRDTLGLRVAKEATVRDQGVRAALLPIGRSEIELLEPIDAAGGVAKFLERRGEGLHHVCFETPDVAAELGAARGAGLPLIDEAPRPGLAGMIGFLHPKGTCSVLVEFATPPPGSHAVASAGAFGGLTLREVTAGCRDAATAAGLFATKLGLAPATGGTAVAVGGITLRFVTGGDDGLSALVLEVSDLAAASRGLGVSSGQDVHLDAARAHGVPLTFRAAP